MKRSSRFLIAAALLSLVVGVLLSPLASSQPDGLERVAEDKGFIENAEGAEVWQSSPLPDYTLPGIGSDHLSTSLAGLLGTFATLAVGFGVGKLIAKRKSGTG